VFVPTKKKNVRIIAFNKCFLMTYFDEENKLFDVF